MTTTIDLSRAHANNPFRQPRFYPSSSWVQPQYPINGSKWLGFGPKQAKVDTQTVHYGGSYLNAQQLSPAEADVIATLQAMNRSSWTSRGYALYYSWYVPTDGALWAIRGFDWRNAANADKDKTDGNENDWTFSVHTVLQKVDRDPDSNVTVEPTWDQLETNRWLRWEAREYAIEAGNPTTFQIDLIGHMDLEPTGCPGDKMINAIRNGVLNIPSRTVPLPIGDDMFNSIFKPTDSDAQFLAIADANGNALFLVWADKQRADAWQAAGVKVYDKLSLGGFTNCVLLGPLPSGDTRHTWSGAEFFRVVG